MAKLAFGQTHDRPPVSVAGGVGQGLDIAFASYEQLRLVDNSNAAAAALEDAYAARTKAVKEATGIDLGNPLFGEAAGFDVEQAQRLARGELGAELTAQGNRVASQKADYARRLAELEQQYPDKAGIIRSGVPVERDAEALAKSADDRLSMLMASNPDWSSYAWAFAGGAVGSFRDPLVVGSLALGGGPGAARTVAGRILTVAAKEALLNGGTTLAAQPFVQDWRRRAGLSHGFDEAATNVLFAAGFGGFLGAAGGGVGEVVGAVGRRTDAARRLEELALVDPELGPRARQAISGDVTASAEALGEVRDILPDEVRGALDALDVRAAERAQIDAAYGLVRGNPTGPVRDPLVEITPDDIDKMIVARGAFRNINELDLSSRRGWGLVKIIWRHGEESGTPEPYQIRRDDITALPDVLRDYAPSRTGETWREWRVLRDDRVIVYADAAMPEGRHLVTAYVQEPGSKGGDLPLSERKVGAGSFRDGFSAPRDTGRSLSQSEHGGQPDANIAALEEADKARRLAAEIDRRHDILMARAEEAERLRQLPDLVLDEPERVNRLVRDLAPRAESISDRDGQLGQHPDFDAIIRDLRAGAGSDTASRRRPVLQFLRSLGGVDPASAIAGELRAIGLNGRSAPGLFSRSGLKALDNIPIDELPDGLRRHAGGDDGNGYVREQAFLDGLAQELEGRPWGGDDTGSATALDEYRNYLEANGVDFARMSDDEIRAQLAAIEDAERRFLAAEPNDMGLSTDEVSFLPPGVTRRAYTAEVVREILSRTGAGVSDDVVRTAANAHIAAGETLEDAIDFALASAAGTRKTLPPSQFAELGSEPPAPKADAVVDPPDEEAIDWGALEELGFGSGAQIPFGDDVISLEALKADLDETAWLESVVSACKL